MKEWKGETKTETTRFSSWVIWPFTVSTLTTLASSSFLFQFSFSFFSFFLFEFIHMFGR